MDAHVYAALASGDLTVEQLNEFTLHFAVYCGWPRASQLEMSVRSQWQRLHEERGEPVPAFPARTIDDLGVADPAERLAAGMACFEEINLIQSPPPDSPYFYAGILNFVFGHLWLRPGLSRRDRRLITIPCVGVGDAFGPIWSHVTSALRFRRCVAERDGGTDRALQRVRRNRSRQTAPRRGEPVAAADGVTSAASDVAVGERAANRRGRRTALRASTASTASRCARSPPRPAPRTTRR